MSITYTLTSAELVYRFAPPLPLRQRLKSLWTMIWPVLLGVVACTIGPGHGFSVIVWKITGIAYGVLLLIMAASWGMQSWIARTNKSATYCVEIREDALLVNEVGIGARHHSWTQIRKITDLGDYLMFDNAGGQHLAVVPKSAFGDDAQAQVFFEQSHRYWSAAQQKQQDEAEQAAGTWPPVPRPEA